MLVRVIVAVDDPALRTRLVGLLDDPEVHVVAADERSATEEALLRQSYDLAIVESSEADTELPRLLASMGKLADAPQMVVLMRHDAPEDRARLLALGVKAVLDAGLSEASLGPALSTLVGQSKGERHRHAHAQRRSVEAPPFIGQSEAMRKLMETARRVAGADSSVLLLGETGVGKERFAEVIHRAGPRASGPFVAVNCAAVPTELFESELFGHERGAFTGAHRARRGLFELAHAGTLFLDEVGEVPLHLQVKLLRALQERRIRPLGSEKHVDIDARVVAATNRDLAAAMDDGSFRRDLYYRLSVIELSIPPLRERPDDVAAMAVAFVDRARLLLGRPIDGFEPRALEAMARYAWPGNVRELLNVVERAVLLCDAEKIRLLDLPVAVAACVTLREPTLSREGAPAQEPTTAALDNVIQLPPLWTEEKWKFVREGVVLAGERAYLSALLRATQGRVGEAAKRAGMSSRALFDKMRRHGLRKENFRDSPGPPVD